ncbi:hypothetical protein KWH45_21075 [Xanthomonas campestris pv. mirabilis]|uniref:LPD29 domain-containing protein n=1 Tax=Xanthomonas euvesicatoria TaxID=456327 RepID=UPI001C45026D|nr:LPD29 domain-containing protein [Xanthomonas euvesicatoria]MBV6855907.1 hypothetical protein [Xanthomonas campestris pv. mirabilis]
MNKLPENQILVVGQRISTLLYGWRRGVVTAIHGEQSPASVGRNGPVSWGGRAQFDIVFNCGETTRLLPESILHGVQWTIYDEVATAEEIAALIANASTVQAIKAQQKADEREAFAAAVQAMRVAPEFKHLDQNPELRADKRAVKNVRASLKKAFPGIKFSVRSDYSEVRVKWTDGPTAAAVDAVVNVFKGGSFNGMEDIYEARSTPFTAVFGSIQYIWTSREYSDEITAYALEDAFTRHAAELEGVERPQLSTLRSGRAFRVPVYTPYFNVNDLQSLVNHIRACVSADASGFAVTGNLRG